ncbi:hypothetical protein D9758_000369 [Tetrapyrgos nigripes]|uniref:CN hydrolase domain-containing protein n=1 Tax=Tetrapyrgos nigripes TaxID=182062 RepID=A0A8H5H147_9AGAR|nr:hypothetical protein D9758_000369 [Tetrapyrgos nigripes]
MSSPKTLRASVVQAACSQYDAEKTLDKLERLTQLAKDRDGAQLVVFPEGYPMQRTFGAIVGNRTPEGREEFRRYFDGAIDVPGPEITRIENVSNKTGVFLIVGVIERGGNTLYCTIVFVDPVEGYVGKHRKLMPTAMERLIWGQEMGPRSQCWRDHLNLLLINPSQPNFLRQYAGQENYMPLCASFLYDFLVGANETPVRYFYYSKGTQIYCAPTVDARPVWQHTMRHIAIEGRCFVLAACQFAQEKDYPPDHPVADPQARNAENVMIAGGSVIVNPFGEVLAGPLLDAEGVLTAELDLNECTRGKFDLDVAGHYARPDVFGFTANVA